MRRKAKRDLGERKTKLWLMATWNAYATQQLSVRLHKAAAWELGQEAGFGVGAD